MGLTIAEAESSSMPSIDFTSCDDFTHSQELTFSSISATVAIIRGGHLMMATAT